MERVELAKTFPREKSFYLKRNYSNGKQVELRSRCQGMGQLAKSLNAM